MLLSLQRKCTLNCLSLEFHTTVSFMDCSCLSAEVQKTTHIFQQFCTWPNAGRLNPVAYDEVSVSHTMSLAALRCP